VAAKCEWAQVVFSVGSGLLRRVTIFFLAARAGGLLVRYCCSPGLLNCLVDVEGA
jgi:hypothetical protein